MYKEIDSYELKELIKEKKINLIDIRNSLEYDYGTIPNSININASLLFELPDKYLTKDKTYYIFCKCGNTSKDLCSYLIKKGYNVINVKNGYQGYLDSIN